MRKSLQGRAITDGTVFIVFDLEWNQPIGGVTYEHDVSALPGEIIEIGAVRYAYDKGSLSQNGTFSCDVRAQVYTTMHYHVKKMTHKTNRDLLKGERFDKAYEMFREFAGDDAVLAGWGNSDPDMLKANLKFFGLDDKLAVPFIDIQPVFSLFSGEKGRQRSVEFAVDHYGIEKREEFHSATSDASYTGEILRKIFEMNKPSEVLSVLSSSMVDPDIKREYSFVSGNEETAEQAFEGNRPFCRKCPLCGRVLNEKIPSFRIRKSEYALSVCEEHGEFFSRTRAKKNKEGHFYAASVIRFATQTDYFLVASKREEFEKFGVGGAPVERTADRPESLENDPGDP